MDDTQQKTLLNSIITAVVLGILGVFLFSWKLPDGIFPMWLRMVILIALFAHLFIRTSWAITSPLFFHETEER